MTRVTSREGLPADDSAVPTDRLSPPAPGRIVAVTGASGGCGVTTIALHLARAFANYSSTCFVEVASASGAAERMALDRGALRTWASATGSDEIRLSALPMSGGFRAAFAPPSLDGDAPAPEQFACVFDRIVLDVPLGTPVVSSVTLLVVAATLPAARRAARLVESADAAILNRTGTGGVATRPRLEEALGASTTIELPHCPGLRDAEDEGRLLRESARWSRRIRRLATSISGAEVQ